MVHIGLGVYDCSNKIIVEDGAYNIRGGKDASGNPPPCLMQDAAAPQVDCQGAAATPDHPLLLSPPTPPTQRSDHATTVLMRCGPSASSSDHDLQVLLDPAMHAAVSAVHGKTLGGFTIDAKPARPGCVHPCIHSGGHTRLRSSSHSSMLIHPGCSQERLHM